MYVCIYVCMYVCMYVYACMHACMYVCMYTVEVEIFAVYKFSLFSLFEKVYTQKSSSLYGSHLYFQKIVKFLPLENFHFYGNSSPWDVGYQLVED